MFRFSIRELMLVTLVVALAAGWILDRYRVAAKLERARDIEQVHGIMNEEMARVAERAELERAERERNPQPNTLFGGGQLPASFSAPTSR